MGDAADILGIKAPEKKSVQFSLNLKEPVKEKAAPVKKSLKQRELQLLTGQTQEAEDPKRFGLREKRRVVNKAVRWRWKGFRNSGREDGAIFYHWEKAREQREDYLFAKYNCPVAVPHFTRSEYEELLKDASWSYEATCTLLRLFKKYNGRFVVIANHYVPARSVEELKHWFFKIEQKHRELRSDKVNDNNESAAAALAYDPEQETHRKVCAEEEYRRSRKEAEAEEALTAEARRIEANQRKLQKELERLSKITSHVRRQGCCYYYTGDHIEGVRSDSELVRDGDLETGVTLRSNVMFRQLSDKRMRANAEGINWVFYQHCGKVKMVTPTTTAQVDKMRTELLDYVDAQRVLERKTAELEGLQNRLYSLERPSSETQAEGMGEGHVEQDGGVELGTNELVRSRSPRSPRTPRMSPKALSKQESNEDLPLPKLVVKVPVSGGRLSPRPGTPKSNAGSDREEVTPRKVKRSKSVTLSIDDVLGGLTPTHLAPVSSPKSQQSSVISHDEAMLQAAEKVKMLAGDTTGTILEVAASADPSPALPAEQLDGVVMAPHPSSRKRPADATDVKETKKPKLEDEV